MKYWWFIVLVLLQPLMYFNGVEGDFVFDDQFLIVDTMGKLTPYSIWTGGLWDEAPNQANFYRPLFSMTIWLDQQLFALHAQGYHVHSLLWHIANLVLFFRFAPKILSESQAILATVVFGCHPLMSELIYWIAARNDTMAMTFALLFLNLFWSRVWLAKKLRIQSIWALTLIFAAGLLSKESILVLFVPVVVHAWSEKRFQLLLSMFAVVGLVFSWRTHIGIHAPEIYTDNAKLLLDNLLNLMVDGLGRLVFPWRLSPASPLAWSSVVWWQCILATVAIWLGTKSIKDQSGRLWLGWFGVSFLLTLPAILHTGNYGDRYWTMGLISWSFIYAKFIPIRFAYIPVFFWVGIIWLRGFAWQSDLDFWRAEVESNPTPYAQVSLAIVEYNSGQSESAMNHFYQGFQTDPPHIDGCVPFVSTVLSVQGAESALQASDWAISRGCRVDGEMMGLRAVIEAGTGRWEHVAQILSEGWDDNSRRLDVVQMALYVHNQEWDLFCAELDTWSDYDRLFAQLKILNPSLLDNPSMIVHRCKRTSSE